MVEKAKHYIREGDIFQVVLSNRMEVDYDCLLYTSMDKYGSDKPDLRINLLVQDATDVLADCGFGPFEGKKVKACLLYTSSALVRAVKEKLFLLPDDTLVCPGHGEETTIGHEKKYNPFV